MAIIRIHFSSTHGPIDWEIRHETNALEAHVDIETDTGTLIGDHAFTGVVENKPNYANWMWKKVYELEVTQEQHDAILAKAKHSVGKVKYDYLDIAGIFIHNRELHDNDLDRMECAGFVYLCFVAAGMYILNLAPNFAPHLTPRDLHLSSIFFGRCVESYPDPSLITLKAV